MVPAVVQLCPKAERFGFRGRRLELDVLDLREGRADVLGIDDGVVIGEAISPPMERLALRLGQHRSIPGEDVAGKG